MTNRPRIYIFGLLAVLAAVVGTAMYFTVPQDQSELVAQSRGRRITPFNKLVDQQPLQIAQQLDKLATTREEARYSREAVRTADHEVDLAFTSALRSARLHPPADTPETKQFHDRIRKLQAQVAADQDQLNKIKAAQASAHGNTLEELNDQQQLASAELALHQDELDDAKRDLMRAGGDDESRIQRLFAMHEASQHSDQQQPSGFQMRSPFEIPGNTVAQLRLMWQLHSKRSAVLQAQQNALSSAKDLGAKHDELENQLRQSTAESGSTNVQAPAKDDTTLAAIQKQAENRKLLSEYDERIQDFQQLARGYGDWTTLLHNRVLLCLRAVLQGVLWILGIVALMVLGNIGVDRLSYKFASDRRHMATMRLLGHFAVQALGLLLIVFVLVGPPNQLSTIIAFAGAGLTVALKDFIVAFFGWFVLMGKNGIRVGDWVEINGIGGEVVEIGLLRTVLLETGNWAELGHPTGRRVTFVNSFAIEGHYFNFSTSGQWLWDKLELLVPTGQDPYPFTDSLLQLVKKESETNAREAEKEWARATREHGMKSFSAEPALSMRPNPQGTTIIVRYIARANERYATRTRLNDEIVQLLQRSRASAVQVQSSGGDKQ
jgi:small-conductance mechanosensitive channel